MPRVSASRVKVNELVESLGIRTDDEELEGLYQLKTWPKLQPHAVKQLFNNLLIDDDTSLERTNSDSFDAELDEPLKRWGPKIWPQSEFGTRDHLLEPKPETRYPTHLTYPRDKSILKQHLKRLREVVLGKPHTTEEIDIEASKSKRVSRSANTSPQSAPASKSPKQMARKMARSQPLPLPLSLAEDDTDMTFDSSDLDDSTVDTPTELEPAKGNKGESASSTFKIQLRLYTVKDSESPPVESYGNISIDSDCTKEDCFNRINEKIKSTKSSCSWFEFQLTEDMHQEAKWRVSWRETRNSKDTFGEVLGLFRDARKVRSGASRAVEVKVGLNVEPDP